MGCNCRETNKQTSVLLCIIYNLNFTVFMHVTLISRYITLYHVTSRYITLYHVISRYITLYHVTSRYITLYHVTSRYITFITLHHVISRYNTLHHIISRYITLYHAIYSVLYYPRFHVTAVGLGTCYRGHGGQPVLRIV